MKNTKILAATLIAALGFTACAKDNGETIKDGPKGIAEVVISFDNNKTRAEGNSATGDVEGSEDENKINTIEFFTFDGSTPDARTPYFRKTADTGATTTFLVDAGNKTFLVAVNANIFANSGAYETAAGTAANVTYEKIKASIANHALSATNSQTAPDAATGFAMAAEGNKNVVAGETNNLSLTLDRVLSKVNAPVVQNGGANVAAVAADLEYLQQLFTGVTAVDNVEGLTWTLDGYVVINGIKNSYNFRYANWTGWSAPTGTDWNKTAYTDDTGAQIATAYAGSGADDQFIAATNTEVVYVYENKPEANTKTDPAEATTFKADQVTAFIIKGHFNATVNSVATQSNPRYWRINLLKSDTWEIYRNSVYTATLRNVLTPGFGTPKEAENDGPVVNPAESSISIDLKVANWVVRTEAVDF